MIGTKIWIAKLSHAPIVASLVFGVNLFWILRMVEMMEQVMVILVE